MSDPSYHNTVSREFESRLSNEDEKEIVTSEEAFAHKILRDFSVDDTYEQSFSKVVGTLRIAMSAPGSGTARKSLEEYPDPTEQDLQSPQFNAVWEAIKGWDVSRHQDTKESHRMYAGANGSDVMHILTALRLAVAQQEEAASQLVDTSAQDMLDRVAEEHAEALRNICLLFGFDPSDGEGTTGDEIYQMVKSHFDEADRSLRAVAHQEEEDTKMLDWLEANKTKLFGIYYEAMQKWVVVSEVVDGYTGGTVLGEAPTLRAAIADAMRGTQE